MQWVFQNDAIPNADDSRKMAAAEIPSVIYKFVIWLEECEHVDHELSSVLIPTPSDVPQHHVDTG